MAGHYPAGHLPRGRSEDDIYAVPPSVNPFAYQPNQPYTYDAGTFPGGPNGYVAQAPLPATVPAYPLAAPAYPVPQPGIVHGASGGSMGSPYGGALYGAGGYGYYPQQQPQPHLQQQAAPARPPRNHAAGPRTQFNKPPGPPVFGSNPDIEAGSFSQLNEVTQFTQKAEAQMRLAFIRKVYSILCLQLIASFGLLAYLTFDGAANAFVLARPGLAYTAIVASFVVLMLLMCYRNSYPTNLGLLAIWTLVEAYTISIITCTYARAGEGEIVLQALGITALLFIALTVFTLQSKWDFSFLGDVLFAGLWILLIWGLIAGIWGFEPGMVYSLIGAVIFSMYIVFDTYMLSKKLPYDEWVLGAISLYIDIINIFVMVLQILAESQERERRRQQQG